jgi:hypothetical protein
MDSPLPDNFLQPVIDALAPTGLGRPKTQAVFDRFLDRFETVLKRGYTYKQIANALKTGNARGRRGAEFTEGALHNYITRAKKRRARKLGRPGTSNVAGEPRGYDLEPPTTSTGQPVSTNAPISPALGEFKQRIAEAKSHAAMDEILFRGRNKRD